MQRQVQVLIMEEQCVCGHVCVDKNGEKKLGHNPLSPPQKKPKVKLKLDISADKATLESMSVDGSRTWFTNIHLELKA